MSGEYSRRIIERAERAKARMSLRLAHISDAFLKHDIYGANGMVDFEKFFKEADACGHDYNSAMCVCTLCQQLRPQLLGIMQKVMTPQPAQGVQNG